jgi:hypothetical protein
MAAIGWKIDPPDAWILYARHDLFGTVGAAVANDEQLKIPHGLIEDARDRIAENRKHCGSKADLAALNCDFRYTPDSGQVCHQGRVRKVP